jgi:hypothetical protein
MALTQVWQPTALLVMRHKVTGLRYFCKTSIFKTINQYKGSGLHWKRHMRKHGRDIEAGVLGIYFDKERCLSAAKKFSEENKIGFNPEWANLIPENGLDGAPVGEAHPMFGKPHPHKGKERPEMKGRLSGSKNGMWGKPSPLRGVSKPKGVDSPLYGRKRPEGGGKKPHPVIRIDADGVETRYDSVADAARALGVSRWTIHTVCTGKKNVGAGYKWRYAEEK